MTQRIFDIENEKDMQDLWSILPDEVNKIEKYPDGVIDPFACFCAPSIPVGMCRSLIKIDWHDATEITRPVDYESMIGCVGWFWDDKIDDDTSPCLGVLTAIAGGEYYTQVETWGFDNFRPAKKSELKFWGEY